MDNKKIIDYSLEVVRKWNILTILFVIPLYLALLTMTPYLIFTFGKLVSQSGNNLVKPVTSIEYYLGFPGRVFGIIYCVLWLSYIVIYIISKRNRIKADLLNQQLHLLMMGIFFYHTFVGLQFFVPFLLVRLLYWCLFIASILYLLYVYKNKKYPKNLRFDSDRIKKLTTYALFLWLFFSFANIFINGLQIKQLLAQLLLGLLPLFPIPTMLGMIFLYRSTFSRIDVIAKVDKNQEKYRQEFGYSIEDWYGKKSKMYKKART